MPSKKSCVVEQLNLPWAPVGLMAGVDEAGRGPLVGSVVAAAVILDDAAPIKGLNDSKKLSAAKRERLYDEIQAKAICCSVAEATAAEVDQLNILQATMLAMQRAVNGLRLKPVKVWVDGNRLPEAFPQYGFDRHKGYGTVDHLQALQQFGPLPEHRRSFAPVARAHAMWQGVERSV